MTPNPGTDNPGGNAMVNRRVILVCVIVVNLYSFDGYSVSVVSSENPAGFDSLAVAVPSFF